MQSPAIRFSKGASASNPIPNGCVLYTPLWHPSCQGITFQSIDPYGHICTRTGGVIGANGITMDGDDVIKVPSHPKFITGTTNHTLLAWFNVTGVSTVNTIFGMGQAATGASAWQDGYLWGVHTLARYYVEARGLGSTVLTLNYNEDQWEFGAVSFKYNDTLSAYLDDNAAVTTTYTTAPVAIDATVDVGIGANHYDSTTVWTYFFTGTIREVWAYDRALSAGEIAYIYNQTRWFI